MQNGRRDVEDQEARQRLTYYNLLSLLPSTLKCCLHIIPLGMFKIKLKLKLLLLLLLLLLILLFQEN